MVLVRFVFQAKWRNAQKVVDEFKKNTELMQSVLGPDVHGRILTDLSGPFDTVVQELEVESLAEWERIRAAMFNNPEFQQAQESGESPYKSGRTEFYTIEEAF